MKRYLGPIGLAFLTFRCLTLGWGILGIRLIPVRPNFLGGGDLYWDLPILWGWANLDGVHYLSIAQKGYSEFEQAFFPLYPLLIRWLSALTSLAPLWVGLILSQFFLLGSLWLLAKLASKPAGKNWPAWLLLAFPTAVFFWAVYTESLFLFLVLLTFYLSRQQKWLGASMAAGLASATRLVGVFLVPALLWEILTTKNKARPIQAWLGLSLAPLGLILYLIYLWQSVGDPLYFFHVQPLFGAMRSGSELILLPQVVWRYLKIFFTVSPQIFDFWVALFEFLATGFAIGYLFLTRRHWPVSWLIFAWATVLAPTLTGTLSSMPRYILPVVALGVTVSLPRPLRLAWFFIFLPIQIAATALFLRGYFIG